MSQINKGGLTIQDAPLQKFLTVAEMYPINVMDLRIGNMADGCIRKVQWRKKKGRTDVLAYLDLQFPMGLGSCIYWVQDGLSRKDGHSEFLDMGRMDFHPAPNGGDKRANGQGNWRLEVLRMCPDFVEGDWRVKLPIYFSKKIGAYRDMCSAVFPWHTVQPEREGRGTPILKDINAAIQAAAFSMLGLLQIRKCGKPRSWPDGRPIEQSCETCAHLLRMYQDPEGCALTSLPDWTLHDKKLHGDRSETDICMMRLVNPMQQAVGVWNEWAAKDKSERVHAIVGNELNVRYDLNGTETREIKLDEKGNPIPIWDFVRIGEGRVFFDNRVLNWNQLRERVGYKFGGDCPYYKVSIPSQKLPGRWLRTNPSSSMCAWFTEVSDKNNIRRWLEGFPQDIILHNNQFTGRMMVNSGMGVFVIMDGEKNPWMWDHYQKLSINMFLADVVADDRTYIYDELSRNRDELKQDAELYFAQYIDEAIAAGVEPEEIINQCMDVILTMPESIQEELAQTVDFLMKTVLG